MKQYIYRPEDIGRTAWPEGTLRLDVPVTENPAEADLFVCPGPLLLFQNPRDLDKFPYMKGRESQHVFFDVSDYETLYSKPCLFIRCNTRVWYYKTDPNTVPWYWPVEDFAECVDEPAGGFSFDVSFQGWLSSIARKASVASCRTSPLKADIAAYADFCGYIYDTPEGVRRRGEFRRSMRESRVALCPESIPGVLPYRFFEAMSAGRVPVLVGSGYVLPFTEEIPYADFVVTVEANAAGTAGNRIAEFIGKHSDAALLEKGREARHYWKTWLHRDDYMKHMTTVAIKRLGVCA